MVMLMHFFYGNKQLKVEIVKKKIKHTYIRVKDENTLVVSTSSKTPLSEIERVLNEKKERIFMMIEKHQKNDQVTFESVTILGKIYPVEIHFGGNRSNFDGQVLRLFVKEMNQETIERVYLTFLKRQSLEVFSKRLDLIYPHFSKRFSFPQLQVRKMKTRWGSCHVNKNKVVLNTNLLSKKLTIVDYVIVHELCHFIHPNHSTKFWDEVGKYIPNYKTLRKELNS
jgi:predicted metal-dependent hydrolase